MKRDTALKIRRCQYCEIRDSVFLSDALATTSVIVIYIQAWDCGACFMNAIKASLICFSIFILPFCSCYSLYKAMKGISNTLTTLDNPREADNIYENKGGCSVSDEMRRLLSIACYVVGAVSLGYTASLSLTSSLNAHGMLLLCSVTLFSLFLATVLRCKAIGARTKKRRYIRLFLVLAFVLYGCVVTNLILFGDHIPNGTNYIPFKTLWGYTDALIKGSVDPKGVAGILLINLALFMPLSFFLLTLFQGLHKAKYFFVIVSILLVGFEALPYVTGLGPFDVDDVLLHLLGVTFVYVILDIKSVRRLMKKWYLADRIKK